MQLPKGALKDKKLGLYAVVFLANMGWGVMSPVLADVQHDFGVSVGEVALANSVFGVARLFLDMPIGMVMHRVDRRWLSLIGALLMAGGLVLSAAASDFVTLLHGRMLNGAGAAVIQVTTIVWISQLSDSKQRGRNLGIYQAVFQAGTSVSPILGGFLAVLVSWRASFLAVAAISLLALLPVFRRASEEPDSQSRGTNLKSSSEAIREETIDRNTMLWALIVTNLITFILFFSAGGYQNTVVPLLGSTVLRLDAGTIGFVVGVSTMLRFLVSLVGGELSDRFGRRAVLIPGFALMALGTLLFNLAGNLTTYWIANLVLSVGRFGNNIPATVLADYVSPDRWGFHMGLNRLIGDLGVVLGPIAMGILLERSGFAVTTFLSAALAAATMMAAAGCIRQVRMPTVLAERE